MKKLLCLFFGHLPLLEKQMGVAKNPSAIFCPRCLKIIAWKYQKQNEKEKEEEK